MPITITSHRGGNPANAGFTIVEALISIILFTITLAGGLAIYVNADRIVTLTTHKRLAVEFANLRMEELRAMNYAAFDAAFPVPDPAEPEPYDDPSQPPVVEGFASARTITVANVPQVATPDYKEVTVNVAWTEADHDPAGQQREVEIQTIIVP